MKDMQISGARTNNKNLLEWIETTAQLSKPDNIYICDGSQEEYDDLCNQMVESGTFVRLTEQKRPNSFLCLSDPKDVARMESRTFVCPTNKSDAGPTNNWMHPTEMTDKLNPRFDGCMRGRTIYVIPYSIGPLGSPIAHIGI